MDGGQRTVTKAHSAKNVKIHSKGNVPWEYNGCTEPLVLVTYIFKCCI